MIRVGQVLTAAIVSLSILMMGACSSTPKKVETEDNTPIKAEQNDAMIGVGDTIDITVYRHDDLKKSLKIDRSGTAMYPLIGDIQLASRSVYSVRDEMQDRLARYIVNPQVTITISGVQSQKVMVLGEVKSPGLFALDTDLLISDAIAKAGGATDDAKISDIYIIRRKVVKQDSVGAKPELIRFDMKDALKTGNFKNNRALQNGDIVYVPTLAIADVAWFMSQIGTIIGPVVTTETGIVLWPQALDVLRGKKSTTNFSVPAN